MTEPAKFLVRAVLTGLAVAGTGFPAAPAYAQYRGEPVFWHEGWISAGALDAANHAPGQLDGQRSRYVIGVGGSLPIAPYTLLDLEAPFYGQKFDAPPSLAATDDLVSVKTRGVAVGLRQVAPIGPLEVYAGLGAGWYESALTASRGAALEDEFVDYGAGFHVAAGLILPLARGVAISVESRRLWLDADFGTATRGIVDLGGRIVTVSLRFRAR